MNTRRYPRTMQEAFGPYTSHEVEPMPTPRRPRSLWQIVYIPTLVAVITWALLY